MHTEHNKCVDVVAKCYLNLELFAEFIKIKVSIFQNLCCATVNGKHIENCYFCPYILRLISSIFIFINFAVLST